MHLVLQFGKRHEASRKLSRIIRSTYVLSPCRHNTLSADVSGRSLLGPARDSESNEKRGGRTSLTQIQKVSDTTFFFLSCISSHTMFIVRLSDESEAIAL